MNEVYASIGRLQRASLPIREGRGVSNTHPKQVSTKLRVPPHSIEAEQSVLGCLLQSQPSYALISDVITAADFYRHEHRLIFGAIAQLAAAGQPVDMITVFEQLEGETTAYGGLAYLGELQHSVASASNVRRYADIVAERATLRALIAASDEMATAAFNPQGRGVVELLEQAKDSIALLAKRNIGASRRLPVMTAQQLIDAASSMRWLCNGVLPAQGIGMVFGASGTFKSFVALDAALHVVHGLPWMGRKTEQGPALWIAAEGGAGIGYRVNAWHRARRLTPSADFVGIPASIDLGTEAWRVVDSVQSSVEITPRLVVVDTLSQTYTGGADENSATDMAAYLRELGARFRDLWKCAVIVVHHSGHSASERPRGSSAIQANTDFLIGCWRDEKEMLATLTCVHQKDGDRFDDATFALSKIDLGTDEHGEPVSHLAARHLTCAEEVDTAIAAEAKAGRTGKTQLLLSLLQTGMAEKELRKAFYEDCGLDEEETRRKAYYRARKMAISGGFMEVSSGIVMTLKGRQR